MSYIEIVNLEEEIHYLTQPDAGLVVHTGVEDLFSLREEGPGLCHQRGNILVVTGPSGAGKDTFVGEIRLADPAFTRVQTATSRRRRDSEPDDAYTWMRQRQEGEDLASYTEEMITAHGLIEHDFHHGQLYGLPLTNLEEAMERGTPLINTDTRGIRTLKSRLPLMNLVSVLICPESTEALVENMGQERDNIAGRLATAKAYLSEARETVDYVVLNRNDTDFRTRIQNLTARILGHLVR